MRPRDGSITTAGFPNFIDKDIAKMSSWFPSSHLFGKSLLKDNV